MQDDRAGHVRRGSRAAADLPAQLLIEQSMGSQLVVVGSRGRGGFAGPMGSVSHTALHPAKCPVAVVGAVVGSE